jgi:multidrug resistance efflux pump
MKGFKAKVENRPEKPEEEQQINQQPNGDNLSNEITKLNELLQSGVLTQEEFEKAKKKLLDN